MTEKGPFLHSEQKLKIKFKESYWFYTVLAEI